MAQIFCDSSFQTTALWTPTKTSQSVDDKPGHPSDAQYEHQIEDCFGQMTQISQFQAQSKAGTATKQRSKLRQWAQFY